MKDTLPSVSYKNECGIMNLDSNENNGTHWTCWYRKSKDVCYYFDSFGVEPPKEFNTYIKTDILYSTYKIQQYNDVICGHLCLLVLSASFKMNYHDILLKLLDLKNGS